MDQRAVGRQPAEFVAKCSSLGKSSDARLLNISPHGCLVELADQILADGNPARIRISGLSSLDGRVIWTEGSRGGIAFGTALHPAVVEYIAGTLSVEIAERLGFGSLASTG